MRAVLKNPCSSLSVVVRAYADLFENIKSLLWDLIKQITTDKEI